ncbi:17093_t:CDS:2, partial [Acaulospora morrowiae]
DETPMEVDVNDEAAVMMLPSWSIISRMDQSTTIALLFYVSSDRSQYSTDKKESLQKSLPPSNQPTVPMKPYQDLQRYG